ncbi:hypothetical protein MNBD_GAMMA09-2707 [hydrothermal vent metagenome]|uniref:Uncharacterized protein n=1 Tax=hydrothermal vent metagenome TaxID=652676 RepID=A0A3B0XHA1_9ZZZZ
MSSLKKSFGLIKAMLVLSIFSLSCSIYYTWICIKLEIYGWLIAGIIIPPISVFIGLWSFIFDVPSFMLPDTP